MTLEAELVALLQRDGAVAALVGAEGVWQTRVPQDRPIPAVAVYRIASPRDYTHDGGQDPLVEVGIWVTCWAASADAAKQICDACRLCLNRSTPGAWGDVDAQVVLVDDEAAVEDNERRALGYRLILTVMAVEET